MNLGHLRAFHDTKGGRVYFEVRAGPVNALVEESIDGESAAFEFVLVFVNDPLLVFEEGSFVKELVLNIEFEVWVLFHFLEDEHVHDCTDRSETLEFVHEVLLAPTSLTDSGESEEVFI